MGDRADENGDRKGTGPVRLASHLCCLGGGIGVREFGEFIDLHEEDIAQPRPTGRGLFFPVMMVGATIPV